MFEALESASPHDPVERQRGVADLGLEPRYNVAPTQLVPVVRREGETLHLEALRWGMRSAARTGDESMRARGGKGSRLLINARAETVAERPSFGGAFLHRRCLILADGFYEWRGSGSRQPFYFRPQGRRSLCFAGLREGSSPGSCCLLTTQANAVVAAVHDRMPVVLEPQSYALWINDSIVDSASLHELLRPARSDLLDRYPVSSAVNRVAIDDPTLLEPVDEAPPPPENLRLF